MRRIYFGALIGLFTAAAFINSGCVFEKSTAQDPKREAASTPSKPGAPLTDNVWIELTKRMVPTVVNISTIQNAKIAPGQPRRGQRDPLLDLLENFGGMQSQGPQYEAPRKGLGTGFIIRKDGLIITNNHVIEGGDTIRVQLTEDNKQIYEAEVLGRDQRTDIAILKLHLDYDLPAAKLGSSKDSQVGEWVMAVGNPFGLGHSVSHGIISAKGRAIDEINRFPFLQTDTAINPGNSGGPLINLNGEVIGVNAAIHGEARGGIAFAIAIDEVKSILPQLEKKGRVVRGYLGINMQSLDPYSAKQLGLASQGIIIAGVQEGGPADKAGLQVGDVILEFNGKEVSGDNELMNIIRDTAPDTTVTVKFIRDGKEKNTKVRLGEFPEDKKTSGKSQKKEYFGQKAPGNLGFKVAAITAELARDLFINPNVKAPVVVEVEPDGPAAKAGMQLADVIIKVNGKTVTSPRQVQEILIDSIKANATGRIAVDLVRRDAYGRGVNLKAFITPRP